MAFASLEVTSLDVGMRRGSLMDDVTCVADRLR